MSDQERLFSLLKKEVRSLLTAVKGGLTPGELEKEYKSMIGQQLPFRALGYQSTIELVMDMPDVVNIWRGGDGSIVLKAIADESTMGIASLVARQKSGTKSQLSRLRQKISLGYASRPGCPLRTQMPRSLPRRGCVPPTLPAVIKSQLKELLRSSPVLLSDFNKAFARHFGRNFEFMHYGFFSMSEVLKAASDIITVEQTRAGSLLTLKESPPLKKKTGKLPQPKVVIQPNIVKQMLPPIGSAPTVDMRSPAPSRPTLSPPGSAPTVAMRSSTPSRTTLSSPGTAPTVATCSPTPSQPTLSPLGSAPTVATHSPTPSQPTLSPLGSAPTVATHSPTPSQPTLSPLGSAPTVATHSPTPSQPTLSPLGSAPTVATRSPTPSQPTLSPLGSAPTVATRSPAPSQPTLSPLGSAPTVDTHSLAPSQPTLSPIRSSPTVDKCSLAPSRPTLSPVGSSLKVGTCSPGPSRPTLSPIRPSPTVDICSPAPSRPTTSPIRPSSTVDTCSSAPSRPTLSPVRSAPTVDVCSPVPSLLTHYQNQTPSQQSNTSLMQLKPEETPVWKCDKMKQLQKQMKMVLAQRGPGGTVSSELKEKIKTVVAQHPEGLLVTRLPSEFEAHFKEMLPLRELGFLTLMELVGSLSDVLHIECKEGEQDWRIFDINSHCLADDDETNEEISLSGSSAYEEASDTHELPSWDFPSEVSKNLEAKLNVVTKIVKPHLGLEEPHIMQEIMKEEIPPDAVQDRSLHRLPQLERAALVGLSVEYVVSPSQFYVQIYGAETSEKLEDMMIEMRRCYASKNVADRYVMPEASVKPGHLCCVKNLQDKWWYRGIIHCVLSDQEVEVFYLDFGNMGIVPKSHLRFLKDCYSDLPAQAIPCCLAQMKPAKGDWTAGAILEFQRLCGLKLLVGVVDEYVDGVLHLFLCDTSSDVDIYLHDVLRLGGHAVICRDNIPSKGFRELNPSTLYLKPRSEQKAGLKKADAFSFLQDLPGTASPEPCKNEAHIQRYDEEREDLAYLKPEQQVQGHGCLHVSAKKSCDCQARNRCKDSPENLRLVPKEQTSQTKDAASPCSVPEMPYLEPVYLCTEIWDEDWIPLLCVEEGNGSTCNNLCSDISVCSGQTYINEGRNETPHSQERKQQTTDPLGSAPDCLSQALEEFYISIVNSQQSTDPSRIALDANKVFACKTQPLPELSAFPVDECNGEAPSKKKEDDASRTQLVVLPTPSPRCVREEISHNNALVFTAELQGSPVFFVPYSPSVALGASARLATSGGYFSLSRRKVNL